MLKQLIIGSVTMGLTIVLHAEMFALYYRYTHRSGRPKWMTRDHMEGRLKHARTMVYAVFWVLLAISAEVWLWALVLMGSGAIQGFEEAVYFSLVCFTTLGFGDIVLPLEWRILSAMIAANGMLIFGWSTAFLFDLMQSADKEPE